MSVTYHTLYTTAKIAFETQGLSSAALEARLLTAHAVGKTPEQLLRDKFTAAPTKAVQQHTAYMQRRLQGEPLAYILGQWSFYGLPIWVTPDVLIPRNDTELLVSKGIDWGRMQKKPIRILDLCSGSGCIGCALGVSLPHAEIVMLDVSTKALELCEKNARTNGIWERAAIRQWDLLQGPPVDIGSFDMICCNPPYIPSADLAHLDASVREYEPALALDGGENGFTFYDTVVQDWVKLLHPSGYLLLEAGIFQAESLAEKLKLAGLQDVTCYHDTQEIPRVVCGKK